MVFFSLMFFTLVSMFHCCWFGLFMQFYFNTLLLYTFSWNIIGCILFCVSPSWTVISVVTQRQISSASVDSDLLSLASCRHSNIQTTMYLLLAVTTTVVTFLLTLIKGFLFCWYYLSPRPPPPGHRSACLFMSICLLFCIILIKMIICVTKV